MKSWSVIPVCDPEQEAFLRYHMAATVICFRSVEEDRKTPGSVVDSSDHHIPPKPGSDQ